MTPEISNDQLADRITALDRHLTAEIQALRRETQAAERAASEAVGIAAREADERLRAHNGLIDQMREQAAHFATREAVDDRRKAIDDRLKRLEGFQARVIGAIGVIALVGVVNLVKVWTG